MIEFVERTFLVFKTHIYKFGRMDGLFVTLFCFTAGIQQVQG